MNKIFLVLFLLASPLFASVSISYPSQEVIIDGINAGNLSSVLSNHSKLKKEIIKAIELSIIERCKKDYKFAENLYRVAKENKLTLSRESLEILVESKVNQKHYNRK